MLVMMASEKRLDDKGFAQMLEDFRKEQSLDIKDCSANQLAYMVKDGVPMHENVAKSTAWLG